MDNQHKHIKGYRDLSEADINLMNEIKEKANELDGLICRLEHRIHTPPRAIGSPEEHRGAPPINSVDPRCLNIARTHLETGVMYLVRSIAQPRSF
jgi:predicted RecB family endonuclease